MKLNLKNTHPQSTPKANCISKVARDNENTEDEYDFEDYEVVHHDDEEYYKMNESTESSEFSDGHEKYIYTLTNIGSCHYLTNEASTQKK